MLPRPIEFGTQICGDLAAGGTREWLVPDGLGGYAMGTVSGLRTRRYHGLLVVAGQTPASRHVGLTDLDPVLTLPGGATVRLGSHEWADGAIAPSGYVHLERFRLVDGLPQWRWRIGDVVLERELALRHGASCVAVIHRLIAGGDPDQPIELALEALCTWRDQHGERRIDGSLTARPAADGAIITSGEHDVYRLRGPGWQADGTWQHGVHHRVEAERGYTPNEDLLLAGRFTGILTRPGDTLEVTAWAGDPGWTPPPAPEIIDAARRRHAELISLAGATEPTTAALALAADAFIVTTASGPDVVAGYPWFGAWSRDTMTSYEGLFLATGRAAQGRALLVQYAANLSEGMLANTADGGTVGYNTADATLWFLHAVDRHVHHTGDDALAAELLPALETVLQAHLRGTRYGIKIDEIDGLLTQGADGEALTWMDARVDGVPVTQRAGKAVCLNALWCNGLAAVAAMRERVGVDATDLRQRREATVAEFRRRFPTGSGHLFDVVDPDDDALRPNQLLAYSLPYAPMEPDPEVLRRIGAALITPIGLRSLDPAHPAYRARHEGRMAERDHAYHQGTVWPWLIGPYASALHRAGLSMEDALAGLTAHLDEYGLGSVSETADGAAPHHATGCPFQAWSVAELLRSLRLL